MSEAGISIPESPEFGSKEYVKMCYKYFDDFFVGDILSDEQDKDFSPNSTPGERRQRIYRIQEEVRRSFAEAVLSKKFMKEHTPKGIGTEPGEMFTPMTLLRNVYSPPWEAALQRWFDVVGPAQRSWAKASRRGAFRSDVVLPGRKREGWTLHIVLDTSGSMTDELTRALGAIDRFCSENDVEQVHIVQCDVEISFDQYVDVGTLENFVAFGFGGSDMTPAMNRLAGDPNVGAVIVLTDGYIYFPEEEPPYETLWCIVGECTDSFPYGTVVHLPGQNDFSFDDLPLSENMEFPLDSE